MEQQTLMQKTIEWWENTIYDAAERLEWKVILSHKYFGIDRDYTSLTGAELQEIYLKEHPQDTKEEVSLSVSVEDAAHKLLKPQWGHLWIGGKISSDWNKVTYYVRDYNNVVMGASWQKEQTKLLENSHAELLELLSKYVSDKERIGWGFAPEHLAKSKKAIETANKLNLK